METLAALAFVWGLIFAMLFLPARRIGPWIARFPDSFAGTASSLLLCFALAWCVVLAGWGTLKLGGQHILPRVETSYFSLPYVAGLLLAPSFAVLVAGYLHARMIAGRPILTSFVREFLMNLAPLAMGVTFLGISALVLLRWHQTGELAARRRSLTFAAEPYGFSFAFFMVCLVAIVGIFFVVASLLALRSHLRPHNQPQKGEDENQTGR